MVVLQHLDYKMLDQRVRKRRDPGTFTCQMAVPLLLLSCHWAATGGSLEAETYAIQHAWSAVQLVALKHSSEAKHRDMQTQVRSTLLHIVYLHVWAATVVSFQTCIIVWIYSEEKERFLHHLSTGGYGYRNTQPTRCVFHKSFKLLSSHSNIPLTKKVCRLSETKRILKENIFFELFIYFSFHSPTQSWQFSSAS